MRAILCGDGTHANYFTAMVREQHAEQVIDLVGYRRDVWAWMKSSDAFVNVSFFEGQPNAVLEAAVCGCPLILSDIPAHREMMDDSSALFVNAGSPEQIAGAIERTLRDEDEARQRARAAEKRVRQLTRAELGRRFEKVYRSLVRPELEATA
jgi:glycosyltransferase involved in cell wall biosynthesis